MRKLLYLAIAAPSLAAALPPEQSPDIELFISGSTAQDQLLENLIRLKNSGEGISNLCQEDTLDIYRGEIDGIQKKVIYCLTSNSMPGIPAGKRLAIHKSSGGSGEGVSPLVEKTEIKFLDLASISACQQEVRVLRKGDLAGYTDHQDCESGDYRAVPLAGISDIEPVLVDPTAVDLVTASQSQLVWGLPVTKNLRNALQAIQGLVDASVPHDAPIREIESNMPSLRTAQLASIFSGNLQSWDQLYDVNGVPASESQLLAVDRPQNPDLSGTTPGAYRPNPEYGNEIYVCRRIDSSGTQASYEIHYLRKRCLASAPDFISPNDGSSLFSGGDPKQLVDRPDPLGRIFSGVGSSDVRACLDAHEQHNRWAIGMLSTENSGNNTNREYRHIKVDGFSPSLENAHQGRWVHISAPSMQWRAEDDPQLDQYPEGIVLRFISDNLGQPRVLRSLNSGFEHTWGQGGYLALPGANVISPAAPVTTNSLSVLPVASLSKAVNGQAQNCNAPILSAPTALVD